MNENKPSGEAAPERAPELRNRSLILDGLLYMSLEVLAVLIICGYLAWSLWR